MRAHVPAGPAGEVRQLLTDVAAAPASSSLLPKPPTSSLAVGAAVAAAGSGSADGASGAGTAAPLATEADAEALLQWLGGAGARGGRGQGQGPPAEVSMKDFVDLQRQVSRERGHMPCGRISMHGAPT